MKKDLGLLSCKHILFQHASLCCETTSRLFGIGKGTVLTKFKVNSALQQAANVFDATSSTPAEIISAGEKVMLVFYDGKMDDTCIEFSLTVKRWQKALTMLNQEAFPPLGLQQNTTATRSFFKFAKGTIMNVFSC